MATGCPVCEQPLPPMAAGCASCGFPTALALDALRALGGGDPLPVATTGAHGPPGRRRRTPPTGPDPQGELCQRIALDTDGHLGILQELGGDTREVGSDLRQAALAQAEGRMTEALDILRRALGRVQDQSNHLFQQRAAQLEERDATLRRAGVVTAAHDQTRRMREMFSAGRRLDAITLLREADQGLGRVEGDWKGLQGLLRQVSALRDAIRDTEAVAPDVDAPVARIRQLMAGPDVTTAALDEASQIAAQTVMTLTEALPDALTDELGRHGQHLAGLSEEHPPVQAARELHADAIRHLRRGRLPEASASLRQLRAALKELAAAPPTPAAVPSSWTTAAPALAAAPASPAPAAAGPRSAAPPAAAPAPVERPAPTPPEAAARPAGAPPPSQAALQGLLENARVLAARVRTLPPESEIAYEAASEIRRATELLRARKLDAAEATLSRLMQTLDAEAGRGG